MSIEIVTAAGESTGYPGTNLTKENVPTVVGALAGIASMAEETPKKQPTGRTPLAQWAGKDAQNQSVTVFLWPEAPAPPVFLNPEDSEG